MPVAETLLALGTIAFPWHVVIGTLVTFAVGSLLSLTHAPPAAKAGGEREKAGATAGV